MTTRRVVVRPVTPFGKLAAASPLVRRPLARIAIPGRARARGDQADNRIAIMGQVLQRHGQAPQGSSGRAPPDRDALRHDQRSAPRRSASIADSMIRAGDISRRHRRNRVDVECAYVLAKARFGYHLGDGTLIDLMSAPAGDGARRPAHGRAGVVRLARARHLARGPGRSGGALACARGRCAGRGPLPRRDRRGRDVDADEAAPRQRGEVAALTVFDRRDDDCRQHASHQRRRLVVIVAAARSGRAARDRAARDDSLAGSVAGDSPTSRARRPGPGRSRSSALARRFVMSRSRSTKPSRRSHAARRNCWRRRGARERERRRRLRSAIRSAPQGGASSARWCTSCDGTAAGSGWRRSARRRPGRRAVDEVSSGLPKSLYAMGRCCSCTGRSSTTGRCRKESSTRGAWRRLRSTRSPKRRAWCGWW